MTERENLDRITESIIGAAIEAHRALGPGLLESAYEACLTFELAQRGLQVERQRPLPLKLSGCKVGLLINFNVKVLKDGIRRMVNDFPDTLRSLRSLR